jgi:hypothetical protein
MQTEKKNRLIRFEFLSSYNIVLLRKYFETITEFKNIGPILQNARQNPKIWCVRGGRQAVANERSKEDDDRETGGVGRFSSSSY